MGVFWVMLNMLEVHRGMQRVLWHILLLIVFWFIYGVLQDILRVLWGILGVLLGIVYIRSTSKYIKSTLGYLEST